MKSQWDCVLENLGEWHGSFTQFDPDGIELEDIPSIIRLEGINQNQAIHLVLTRLYGGDRQPHAMVVDFSTPGAGAIFFETGAFSEGPLQFSPFRFGAEFCLIGADIYGAEASRRLRLVQMYDSDGNLRGLTLIRERRAGTNAPERDAVTMADILGKWQGTAVQCTPEAANIICLTSQFELSQTTATDWVQHRRLAGETLMIEAIVPITVPPTAPKQLPRFLFEQEGQSYQTWLLPDGAFTTCPRWIQPGQPFFLEMGWHLHPQQQQRLIRRYDAKGQWLDCLWVIETRDRASFFNSDLSNSRE
jgi:hypothetical protein